MAATLVFKQGLATGATNFLNILDDLLINSFSSVEPRGLGWSQVYADGYDYLYFSQGTGQSERIYLRLKASDDDTYIDRTICQLGRASDGYMLNPRGGDSTTRVVLGSAQFEYWICGNQDFLYFVTLIGSEYSHYYCGILNRFAPNQNSSIYGQTIPSPVNTTVPSSTPFTVATNTTLYLRTEFDSYGGYGANNSCFIAGQKLYIIDQSLGTSTVGHQGIVVLNSVDTVNNAINVSYVSGDNTFSSFAIIGVDPQPVLINTNKTIRGNSLYMLDDFLGESAPLFNAIDEYASGASQPAENIQGPDSRGVIISYPIRISNSQEIRGTLFGCIDVPMGQPGAGDILQTFDNKYRFIIFPDGSSNMIALGSVI